MIFRAEPRKRSNQLLKATLPKAREGIVEVSEIPEIGKISPEIFNELIFPRLGAKSEKVLVGPIVDPFWKAFYNALEKYKSL